ncbi:hypothetical protein MTO96_022770 [Rhipicephalus appendiculatus]
MGGRHEEKWKALFGILQRQNVALACLAETHLRDSITPPPNERFIWVGLNYVKGDRKGGGLGFLSKVGSKWHWGCTKRDISELNQPVVVLGDFNSHIEDPDGRTDRAGMKLPMAWVERLGMLIVDTTKSIQVGPLGLHWRRRPESITA